MTPIKVVHMDGERIISSSQWELMYCTSGVTLRAACKGEGLKVSGTNEERGRRLAEKGLTNEQVEARYGWRARRGETP